MTSNYEIEMQIARDESRQGSTGECSCHWGIRTSMGVNARVHAATRAGAVSQYGRLMSDATAGLNAEQLAGVAKMAEVLAARPEFRRCPECTCD